MLMNETCDKPNCAFASTHRDMAAMRAAWLHQWKLLATSHFRPTAAELDALPPIPALPDEVRLPVKPSILARPIRNESGRLGVSAALRTTSRS
jgi:hypothetical protein